MSSYFYHRRGRQAGSTKTSTGAAAAAAPRRMAGAPATPLLPRDMLPAFLTARPTRHEYREVRSTSPAPHPTGPAPLPTPPSSPRDIAVGMRVRIAGRSARRGIGCHGLMGREGQVIRLDAAAGHGPRVFVRIGRDGIYGAQRQWFWDDEIEIVDDVDAIALSGRGIPGPDLTRGALTIPPPHIARRG